MKRKLYETFARLLAGGARGKGREDSVWALGAERIRLASKGYTFGDENVYVSQSKRIRFERKTYTFQARNVYVLVRHRIRLLRPRCLVALF